MFVHGFHVILHKLSTKRPHPCKGNPWVEQCLAIHSPLFIGLNTSSEMLPCMESLPNAQNCTKMRRLSSSSCWSPTCRSKAPGQLDGVKDNCRTLNIDECEQTYKVGGVGCTTHQSTPNQFKTECLICYSYWYFHVLDLIHSALCRPTSQAKPLTGVKSTTPSSTVDYSGPNSWYILDWIGGAISMSFMPERNERYV